MSRGEAQSKLSMLVNLSEAKPKHGKLLRTPRYLLNLVLFCPKHNFIIFISKQEQHKHNLHAILVKLHIKNILNGATVKKLRPKTFTVASSVNRSETASRQAQTWQKSTFY